MGSGSAVSSSSCRPSSLLFNGIGDGVKSPVCCVAEATTSARHSQCTPAPGRHRHASESPSVRLPVYRTYMLSHRWYSVMHFLRVRQRRIVAKTYRPPTVDSRYMVSAHRSRTESSLASLHGRCLPAQAGYRCLPAVAYLWPGMAAQVSVDSESAAPESAYPIVAGQADG